MPTQTRQDKYIDKFILSLKMQRTRKIMGVERLFTLFTLRTTSPHYREVIYTYKKWVY